MGHNLSHVTGHTSEVPAKPEGRRPLAHLASAEVVQRRELDSGEQERLRTAEETLDLEEGRYLRDKARIESMLGAAKRYPTPEVSVDKMKYLYNRMEHYLPELDSFFTYSRDLSARAPDSVSALRRLEGRIKWYQKGGDGRNVIDLTLRDLEAKDHRSIAGERDELGAISGFDEEFFARYLEAPRPPVTVYRGDGRGVDETFLEGFAPQNVLAGGRTDISFFGVVQHTHSSVNKNGMVSTTTDRNQAYHWAIDDHNYGVVYEFRVTRYIDVADLLALRNFKNRFAAQLEILVPGNIPADELVSVTLYRRDEAEPVGTWP